MKKRSLALPYVYRLLEPGPVVLVTTRHRGRSNVMAQSWHTMLDFSPPIAACVISNRSHTFGLLKAARECAINIPTADLADRVVRCGNVSGRKVDKFAAFDLTAVPASRIDAPLIAECYANLECRVVDTAMVNRYNLFVLEVVKAWIDPSIKQPQTIHHRGRGSFMVAGRVIKLPSRMP
jgi:flavin reductase (DIM6/NTAB) family NADH-FMN oxidoreductase RutF